MSKGVTLVKEIKLFLSPGFFPFSLAFFFLLFILFYQALGLPSSSEIIEFTKSIYEDYGLTILALASFVEAIFMISMYLPGSLVILMAVFSLGSNVTELLKIDVVAISGFTLANILNYYLGKFGYYKFLLKLGRNDIVTNMEQNFKQHTVSTIFFSSFHPNFLAIAFICAGISRKTLWKVLVLSIATLSFWVIFWTILAKLLINNLNLEDQNQAFYFLLILVAWGLLLSIKQKIKRHKS